MRRNILVLTPIMVGILAHHFTLGMGFPIPLAITAILVWMMVENREKYMPMIKTG